MNTKVSDSLRVKTIELRVLCRKQDLSGDKIKNKQTKTKLKIDKQQQKTKAKLERTMKADRISHEILIRKPVFTKVFQSSDKTKKHGIIKVLKSFAIHFLVLMVLYTSNC